MTDLIVIGAGPAGMAAAATAAQGGARVLLLDEQPHPGGQIYRNITQNRNDLTYLGPDYASGLALAEALKHPALTCRFESTVWRIDEGPSVAYSRHGTSHLVNSPQVLIATGAQERPTPFPGWTLPGVMPAGAAQILMKSADLLPHDAILAGSGPLLYQIAAQMIDAGSPPLALVETQSLPATLRALPKFPRALMNHKQIVKGVSLLGKIRRAGVARYTAARDFRVEEAEGRLAFSFICGKHQHKLACTLLLTHQGVVPATHLTRSAGLRHTWNPDQLCWQPERDNEGRTSAPGLWVAGDGAGIFGAQAARAQGVIAAGAILQELGTNRPPQIQHALREAKSTLRRARALRPFLDAAYPPAQDILVPRDETILCRCEEITAGQIRTAAHAGADGPRQVKTATRAGMGPCQGRICDLSVVMTLAQATGRAPPDLGPHRARSPSKPITLDELSRLDLGD